MNNNSSSTLYYFTISMTVIYALLGIYIMISGNVENLLPGNKKYIIGTLLILYAFYRGYRIIRIKNAMNRKEE